MPNPITDSALAQLRARFREALGPPTHCGYEKDLNDMGDEKSLTECVASLKAAWESPQGQANAAEHARLDAIETVVVADRHFKRQLENLSAQHVGFVRKFTSGPDMVPREPVPDVWAKVRDRWDHASSILMIGPTNTQKTTTATWCAMGWALAGGTVYHTTAIRVCRATDEQLITMRNCGLLLLDEIHRLEGMPEWQRTPCIDLVDFRYQSKGALIGCATTSEEGISDIIGGEVERRFGLRLTTTDKQESKP